MKFHHKNLGTGRPPGKPRKKKKKKEKPGKKN